MLFCCNNKSVLNKQVAPMSKDKSVFLNILDLDPEELKTILTIAVNLLYADGLAEIEEWNILSLIPALLDVVKEDTSGDLKQKWDKKLAIASKALEEEWDKTTFRALNIKKKIKSPGKRKSCLLLLFILATSDRKIHQKELDFIIDEIARPWEISKQELVSLVKSAESEIHDAQTLITLIEKHT
jgi:uncharacterized tellurite resistance protein B-like protein